MIKSVLTLSTRKLENKTVLVRVDFNVPYIKGKVTDDFRIKKTLPLINELVKRKTKVILISHLEVDGKLLSLSPIVRHIKKHGCKNVKFVNDILGKKATNAISRLNSGDVLILENLRFELGEKKNSKTFARHLASYADIYVNEAFSVSHRKHASIVGISKHLPAYAGPLFIEEITKLKKAFHPARPFLLVLGGKKISTKIGLLEKFLEKADKVFLGGAMVNNFFKVLGCEIGQSYIEKKSLAFVKEKCINPKKIILPRDVIVLRGKKRLDVCIGDVQKKDIIYDLGPDTMMEVNKYLQKSKFVLWNGPLGYVEGGFDDATNAFARALARSKAKSIIGGGDTVAVLKKLGLIKKYYFVSTGGGAMLEFLSFGTLPGIKALEK